MKQIKGFVTRCDIALRWMPQNARTCVCVCVCVCVGGGGGGGGGGGAHTHTKINISLGNSLVPPGNKPFH